MTADYFSQWKENEFSKFFHEQYNLDRPLLVKATEGVIAFPSLGRNSMFAQPAKKDIRLQVEDNNTPTLGGKTSK